MKKIINTILGVLVRWYLNINDAIVTIYEYLSFRFHFIRNYQESLEFDKKIASKNREIKILESINNDKDKEYQELLKIHAKDKNKISNLEISLSTKTNRIISLENTLQRVDDRLQDVNKQYEEVFHNYTETSVELTKLKESFNKTRGKLGGVQAENNRLSSENEELLSKLVTAREELLKTKNKNKFLESKLPKKTLEEIKAYTYNRKEVLKRSKRNDRKD